MKTTPQLFILGRPLNENELPPKEFLEVLQKCKVVIGESRRINQRIQSRLSPNAEQEFFSLDNQNPREKKEMEDALGKLIGSQDSACLFSDMGMPLLFDPGKEVLDFCKKQGFTIRCLPGPTSWGTACALSGWSPPFVLIGFLPPKREERIKALQKVKDSKGHIILMDTPYRFRALLSDCVEIFGPQHFAFLAWEIGEKEEHYFWDNLNSLEKTVSLKKMEKGEFILLLQDPSVK